MFKDALMFRADLENVPGPPPGPPPQNVTHLFFGAKLLFFKSARLFRCPWGRRPSGPRVFWLLWNIEIINLEHEIYDIGTEILYETCFGHNSTQNAPKSMIPGRIKKSTTFPIIWQCQIKI